MTVMETEDSCNVTVVIRKRLSPLTQVEVEPVGRWFHSYEARRLRGHLISSTGDDEAESSEDEGPEVEIEDDIQYLRSLDPSDWKHQDHYAVLGLKIYRYKATDEDIKRAYRLKVLRHHPDKRRGAGEEIREGDDYFTCITRAYEVLGLPSKRRSFDSVDPEFDDDVPAINANSKANFFKVFTPVFERNARWCTSKHVAILGKEDDPKEKVDRFYSFWYDFDSWREFSYLDEEEKEKGQDRDERRWIEKQNKVERAIKRKEEMVRMRKLVDNAYACDPRIAKFKDEEKERKLANKKARQDAARQKQEDEDRVHREAEEAEQERRRMEEAEQKAKQEVEKKEREVVKKALKKERKTLRTLCKDNEYYTTDVSRRVDVMTEVELLCEALELTRLETLNRDLGIVGTDKEKGCHVLNEEVLKIRAKIQREREGAIGGGGSSRSSAASVLGNSGGGKVWSSDDMQLLIKAVNLFPAGTSKRWDVVAEYLNQHSSSGVQRNSKEVLARAKEMQQSGQQLKMAANQNAYQNLTTAQGASMISDETASQRYESPQEMLGMNTTPWSEDEQKLLEQALKTFSNAEQDRWDKIANCLPNRSKKDCMKRYKELVEMVKAKKAVQAAMTTKK